MLELVIGSSAICLGLLLAIFMGGMCLGSFVAPQLLRQVPGATAEPQSSIRAWAVIEFAIGALGLLVLVGLPEGARLYARWFQGSGGMMARGVLAACFLLPPTVLMGATLPILSRSVRATREGVCRLGFLYAANITGAVFGCLLAGFYLLRVHDMATATVTAAMINVAIGLAGLWLAGALQKELRRQELGGNDAGTSSRALSSLPFDADDFRNVAVQTRPGLVYLAIGSSGMCALAAEVVWTRFLSLILGPTVYTFSVILAVFLAALGLGSAAGAFLVRRLQRPAEGLAWCQILLTAAIAWSAYILCKSLPYWPINTSLSRSLWFNVQLDLLRCAWALVPAPLLWGASFPLALAAAKRPGIDPARLVGRVYAANTLGAIFGALGCSLALIPWLGTQQTQRLLVAFSALSGFLLVFSRGNGGSSIAFRGRTCLTAALLGCLMAWSIPKLPWQVVAYGRNLPTKIDCGTKLYLGEGRNATVAVTELDQKSRLFHVSGKVEASSAQQDMRLQRMLGHLPALLHPQPSSVLVVGCGAGVTAGSFVLHPDVENIVICEIEPLIPQQITGWFADENYHVLQDPRVTVHYDDARHFVLLSGDKYDIITSDPIHPWVKGSATLFTKEYFQLCRDHLKPGGLVTQWLPLYDSNLAAVKCAIRTFMEVFPNGTIWENCDVDEGYDVVLLGQAGPLVIQFDNLQKRLASSGYKRVADSLHEVGIRSAFSLMATYAGQGSDLQPWLQGSQLNTDRNLRLQYLAGFGINLDDRSTIYYDLVRHRRYPEELFRCSSVWSQALRKAISGTETNR